MKAKFALAFSNSRHHLHIVTKNIQKHSPDPFARLPFYLPSISVTNQSLP